MKRVPKRPLADYDCKQHQDLSEEKQLWEN